MNTPALLSGIRERIEALTYADEQAALKVLLAGHLHGQPADACRLCSLAWTRGTLARLDAMLTELRLRCELVALDELLTAELEDLKLETLGRTPGGLDHHPIDTDADCFAEPSAG
jgi:hypothetical protein